MDRSNVMSAVLHAPISPGMNVQTPAIVKQDVTAIIGKGGMSLDVARSFAGRCFYLAFTEAVGY